MRMLEDLLSVIEYIEQSSKSDRDFILDIDRRKKEDPTKKLTIKQFNRLAKTHDRYKSRYPLRNY